MTLWPWLRKYGGWLGAGALLVLGFLLGVAIKKRPVIAAGADSQKKDIEARTAEKEQAAVQEAERAKASASVEHATALQEELAVEQRRADVLKDDAAALNQYLKETGTQVRRSGS